MRSDTPEQRQDARFATTHWSLVVAAGRRSCPESRQALAELCETYWYPLYAFVRRRGHDVHEAQDLTQGFITSLLEREDFRLADPQRGRFRSFLLAALNHYLANQRDHQRAQKRGGGRALLSLDWNLGESRYANEPGHQVTPERVFLRRWALTVLETALQRLKDEESAAGREGLYDQLKEFLIGEGGTARKSYRDVGEALGISEGAVKVAVHRLRKRFRKVLREQIAQIVAGPEDIDDEIRELFQALGS